MILETALAIPLLLAVAVALTWGVVLAATTLSLGDTARSAAREIARGEPVAEALDRARSASPGASVWAERSDGLVRVVVEQEVSAPVPLLRGLSTTVRQQVAVPAEWEGGDAS